MPGFENISSKRVPLSVIEKTPEYQRLTPKQKLFVSGYIGGGYNATESTLAAYHVKDRGVAQRLSYALLRNIKIIDVLNMHFGTEPPEAFLVVLDRALRSKHLTIPQVKALRLKAEVLEFKGK